MYFNWNQSLDLEGFCGIFIVRGQIALQEEVEGLGWSENNFLDNSIGFIQEKGMIMW